MEKKHSGKAWLALIACIITMMFGYGIPTNCLGTLYAGMSADMDAPTSAIMLFSTFKAVKLRFNPKNHNDPDKSFRSFLSSYDISRFDRFNQKHYICHQEKL